MELNKIIDQYAFLTTKKCMGLRNMSFLKKFFVGFCLIIGSSILLRGTIDLLDYNTASEDKKEALAAMVVLGLPSIAIGVWLFWSSRQQDKQQLQQVKLEKEQVFLSILQKKEGRITITEFALSTKISLEESKEYLDKKAQKLNADFEITDEGTIIYKFYI